MKVITGGAGFIGSHVVAALNAAGEVPVVVDRFGGDDKYRNLLASTVDSLVAPDDLFEMLDERRPDIDGVVHMGAISSTTETDVDLILDNNFRLSCRLWTWCAQNAKPFVYASSAAVYGDGAHGFDDTEDVAYLARLRPLNPYGWSKLLFDRWVLAQIASGRPAPPKWFGLRFFNVYGPNEAHKGAQRSVATQCFERAMAKRPALLFASARLDYADGEQMRDFIWVGDCVDAVLHLPASSCPSGIYNLGTGLARSFNDLARCVFRSLELPAAIEYVAMPASLTAKYQYRTQADIAKLRTGGYGARLASLEDGVREHAAHFAAAHDG